MTEDLLTLIRGAAGAFGDRTFMTFGDGTAMSFESFARRVAGFRKHLRDKEVAPGDRVGVMLKNSLFYPVAWLGTVTYGAVAVPINSRLGEVDAGYIMRHSGCTALVYDDATASVAKAAAPEEITVEIVARAGDAMGEFELAADPGEDTGVHAGSLANIQYTSGTTGFPKGCLLTHEFWQRMGASSAEAMAIGSDDVLLTSQPHSYIDPPWNAISTLQTGAHLVLLDAFHPSTFMREAARFGVTVFYCIGAMPTLLLKQPPAEHDRDNSLQRVYCSAIPVEHHAAIEERWGAPWYELFGMTESGANLAVRQADHDRLVGSGCIGSALPHCEVSVVDENDRALPAGEVGEMVLRGLGFMSGYHNDPEATAAFFRNGWAHTGDLVERGDDGLIYYRGRSKEMIRRGGENIAPVEVETALSTHPDVMECAVAPVADPDLGEEIKAYVVPQPGTRPRPADLAAYLGERIASFKVPRYWEFRAELPHTSSEKVAKHELERLKSSVIEDTVDLKASRNHAR